MGSFKQLKSSDVITVPVIANKNWNFNYCPIPTTDPYISVYNGTNYTNSFDPGNEPITNTHYDRLTYKQINQLFYHQYSGSLNTASLASSIHYLSASSQHPSASFFNYNNDPAFISYFPTGANETIRVIQISPDAYGNRVLPYSFQMSSSQYSFYDDGKGNVYDDLPCPSCPKPYSPPHVGNIFYSEGTVVITSQAYQSIFVLPAVAYDDVYNIVRNDYPNPATFSFYPLVNDDLRGNTLVNNSIQIFGGDASFFSTGSNNSVSLSFSGLGVGIYQTFYTFLTTGSYCAALMSSTASITVNVTDPECEFEIGITIPPPYPPCGITLNSVTLVSGNTWSYDFTPDGTCGTIILEYSDDGITWGSSAGSCISPRTANIGGLYGTLYFRVKQICSVGGPAASNVIIIPNVSASPTPTISVTPTRTPTVSITPTRTPTVTPTATISITPSLTPTPSPSTPFEFRGAKSCCNGSAQVIAVPSTFGAGYYVGTDGQCYDVGSSPTSGPATITWNGGTLYANCLDCSTANPCASPSPTPTPTKTATPSATPSQTPSQTPSVTPSITVSKTPSVTPSTSLPGCAVSLNNVIYIGGTQWALYFTAGASCGTILVEYSNDGITWGSGAGGCTSPRIADVGGLYGTLYFRVRMFCGAGGPTTSNTIIVNNVSATPTPTPTKTATPSKTPSITVSPSLTPSKTPSVTPSVTPSTSPPVLFPIYLPYGEYSWEACEGLSSYWFCFDTENSLCTATAVYNSDGVTCYSAPAAIYFSDGTNVRYWNGTSFSACSLCP